MTTHSQVATAATYTKQGSNFASSFATIKARRSNRYRIDLTGKSLTQVLRACAVHHYKRPDKYNKQIAIIEKIEEVQPTPPSRILVIRQLLARNRLLGEQDKRPDHPRVGTKIFAHYISLCQKKVCQQRNKVKNAYNNRNPTSHRPSRPPTNQHIRCP